jgi:hypothetical protein
MGWTGRERAGQEGNGLTQREWAGLVSGAVNWKAFGPAEWKGCIGVCTCGKGIDLKKMKTGRRGKVGKLYEKEKWIIGEWVGGGNGGEALTEVAGNILQRKGMEWSDRGHTAEEGDLLEWQGIEVLQRKGMD